MPRRSETSRRTKLGQSPRRRGRRDGMLRMRRHRRLGPSRPATRSTAAIARVPAASSLAFNGPAAIRAIIGRIAKKRLVECRTERFSFVIVLTCARFLWRPGPFQGWSSATPDAAVMARVKINGPPTKKSIVHEGTRLALRDRLKARFRLRRQFALVSQQMLESPVGLSLW
jgi:hypothetical protein